MILLLQMSLLEFWDVDIRSHCIGWNELLYLYMEYGCMARGKDLER